MERKPPAWYRILRTGREKTVVTLYVFTFGILPVLAFGAAAGGIVELLGGDLSNAPDEVWPLILITGALSLYLGVLLGYVTGFRRRDRDGPLPDHESSLWLGPLARRRYWRPVRFNRDLKLTKREYDRMTPGQKVGSEFMPLSSRQKRRMAWLNRPGGPEWAWRDNGEDAWCEVAGPFLPVNPLPDEDGPSSDASATLAELEAKYLSEDERA